MNPFVPTAAPQPATATYPIFPTLEVLGDFNKQDPTANANDAPKKNSDAARAAIIAAGGVVGDWDPTFKINGQLVAKYWADLSQDGADDDQVIYWTINVVTGAFTQMLMTVKQARTFNVPGRAERKAFIIPKTPATGITNATYLCSVDDALKLATKWGLTLVPADLQDMTPTLNFQANGETRREWGVPYNGRFYPAGVSIAQQNAHGLDPDGSWATDGAWSFLGGPTWIGTPDVDDGISASQPQAVVANPVRKLNTMGAQFEVFDTVSLAKVIRRTDITADNGGGSIGDPWHTPRGQWVINALAKGVPGLPPIPA